MKRTFSNVVSASCVFGSLHLCDLILIYPASVNKNKNELPVILNSVILPYNIDINQFFTEKPCTWRTRSG